MNEELAMWKSLSSPCRFPNTPGGFRGAKRPVWNYLRWPASGVPLWGPPVRNHRRGAAVPQRDGSTARFARKWPKQLSVSGTSLVCEAVPGAAWLADSALPSEKRTVSSAKPAGANAMLGPPQRWMHQKLIIVKSVTPMRKISTKCFERFI